MQYLFLGDFRKTYSFISHFHICFLLQILAQVLTTMHSLGEEHPEYKPVHTYVMNPKAVSMGELYGEVNKLTLEWQDGLMPTVVRITVSVSTITRVN